MSASPPLRAFVALMLGVFCCSTSAIAIKASDENPILLAAWRLLLAALLLSPLFARQWARHGAPGYAWHTLRNTALPGVALALHFMAWMYAARMTPVANATLIANTAPIAMPFLLFVMLRETPARNEWVGGAVSMIGIFLLAGRDFRFDAAHFHGDLLCLVSMLVFCVYLALARSNRDRFAGLWLYVVPLYAIAGLVCLAVAAPLTPIIKPYPAREALLIVFLTVVPTIVGHSLLNWAMKNIPGQTVSIVNLTQFMFAGFLGWMFFAERPPGVFYLASALVVWGIVLALRAGRHGPSNPDPAEAALEVELEAADRQRR